MPVLVALADPAAIRSAASEQAKTMPGCGSGPTAPSSEERRESQAAGLGGQEIG